MEKFSIQLEYINLVDKAIKVNILNEKQEVVKKAHFDYTELTFTFEKITNDIRQFVDENHFDLEEKMNVIVSSNEIYSTTIVLPKTSKTKIFIENEIADKFGLTYKDKFSTFISTSNYRKDGTISYVSLVNDDLVMDLSRLAKSLGVKLGEVSSINLLLAEKEQTNSLISEKKAPHISVYVRNLYSVINVVINGQLISSYITHFGYQRLTKDNVVKRMDSIQHLNSLVLSLAGENELIFKNAPIEDFYLYCKDEVLRNQFITKKLNIPYYFVADDEFKPSLFKKNIFNIKKLLPKMAKGMTLVEVIVSVSIFAISAAAMYSLVWACYNLNNKDDLNLASTNFVSDLYERFKVDPNGYLNTLYSDNGITTTFDLTKENTLYLDSSFKVNLDSNSTYNFKVSALTSLNYINSIPEVKYTQTIGKIISTANSKEIHSETIFVTTLKN
jgi:prepilin-type N-terminal cleavage/methylation domain-containing protein